MTITVTKGTASGWTGVYVGRPQSEKDWLPQHVKIGSPLGNRSFPRARTEEEHLRVCESYRQWLKLHIRKKTPGICKELQRLKELAENGNLQLDCWCKPLPCHADVIKRCLEWAIESNYTFWS